MRLQFYKYHGTGNDFILIDNRQNEVRLTKGANQFFVPQTIWELEQMD
jgi:diaminopimelate epimerase